MYRKSRILRFFALGVSLAIVLGAIAILFIYTMSKMVEQDTRTALQAIAHQGTLKIRTSILDELSALEIQSDFISTYDDIHDPQIIEILSKRIDEYRYVRTGVLLPDGSSANTDMAQINLSHRDYFKQALQGKSVVSDVLENMTDNTMEVIVLAVPIWKNGKIIGVLRGVHDIADYGDMLDMSLFGEEGHAHVVRSDGKLILATGGVQSHQLFTSGSFSHDPRIATDEQFAKMVSDMAVGNSGLVELPIGNSDKNYVDYRPLGINDWYLVSTIPASSVLTKVSDVLRIASGTLLVLVVVFLYIIISFIIAKEKKEAALERIAFTDPITGMDNWERLKYATEKELREGKLKGYSYILIGIDNLKVISEIAGYVKTNGLVKRIGKALSDAIGEGEFVVRAEHDRFALLVKSVTDTHISDRVGDIQQRLDIAQEEEAFHIVKGRHMVFSYGVAVLDPSIRTLGEIHEMASAALESKPSSEKKSYILYNQSLHLGIRLQKELEDRFESAIQHEEFIVYYQPIMDIENKTLYSMEALVRWNHPIRGQIPPMEYIPFLEKNGNISLLDRCVLKQVCKLLKNRIEQGLQPIYISINVSRSHLLVNDFVETYVQTVKEFGLDPKFFCLELTETTFIDAPLRIGEILSQLTLHGFTIAIDDFGSGYSALNLLYDLPASIIKIDRKFLSDLRETKKSESVFKHMLQMIEELGMVAVAEGVETEYQVTYLQSVGCPLAQGFYYARPLPPEQAFEMV